METIHCSFALMTSNTNISMLAALLLLILSPLPSFSSSSSNFSNSSFNTSQLYHEYALILLEIKSLLIDPTHSLQSWSMDKSSSVCMDWVGITCTNTKSSSNHDTDQLINTNSSLDNAPTTGYDVITTINLANKNLSGSLSPAIGSLTSLQVLNLTSNWLSDSLPIQLMDCRSLQKLDLSTNNFSGEIPVGFSKLANIEVIDLWTNSFTGAIPQDIVLCSNLHYLDLGGSYLEGSIPPGIGNLTKLRYLTLAGNLLSGFIPTSIRLLSQLEWLYLGYNELNGIIPYEIGELTRLNHLDLVHNNLSGPFPPSITNLTRLRNLFLYDNMIEGPIPPSVSNLTQLLSLDLSNNKMVGTIPGGISNLKSLQILNLFSNGFNGEIPNSIVNLNNLQVLALWKNSLSGEVPAGLGVNSPLMEVDLSSNQLIGPIPQCLCASKVLKKLILFTNYMNGPIPTGLSHCHSLRRVRIQGNLFNGTFPSALGSLPSVYYLDISSNNLNGNLDDFTWNMPSLQVLHLQSNHFRGSIPPSLLKTSKTLFTLDLSHNALSGSIPSEIGFLSELNTFNVSGNAIEGELNDGLLKCVKMVSLDLSNNNLSGQIPTQLANMKMLSTLDISCNKLSGSIPLELGGMESLVYVNVSFNCLSGKVPLNGAFMNINASAIQGNEGLCGGTSLGPCTTNTSEANVNVISLKTRIIATLLLICLLLAMACLCHLIWKLKQVGFLDATTNIIGVLAKMTGKARRRNTIRTKRWGEWSLELFQQVNPSIEDILESINNQEIHLLEKRHSSSRGSHIMYKSMTQEGETFATMELTLTYGSINNEGFRSLEDVLRMMGTSTHPNIVNVYGICSCVASSIVVFEVVDGIRLSSLLNGFSYDIEQGGEHHLDWPKRLDIAIGIAEALVHLHSLSIIYGCVCSYNVLVEWSTFGVVARLLPPTTSGTARLIVRHDLIKDQGDVGGGGRGYDWEEDVAGFGEILVELCGLGGGAWGDTRKSRSEEDELRKTVRTKGSAGRSVHGVVGNGDDSAAEECRRAMDIKSNARTRKIEDEEEEEEKAEGMVAFGRRLSSRRATPQSMPEVLQVLLTWKHRRTC